jgi:hypothetical protein
MTPESPKIGSDGFPNLKVGKKQRPDEIDGQMNATSKIVLNLIKLQTDSNTT